MLGVAEMDGPLRVAIEEARGKIKDHFRDRDAENARTVVEQWIEEKVYPYEGEPSSPIEAAERQVFDIVAVSLTSYSPELDAASPKSKALHLRLLRHAIENSPDDLQLILNEVLQLPARKQKEFAALLKEVTLAGMITASKTVADRLKFIDALELLVFDRELKTKLKERSQLHKILSKNTWIFGEEYNLWVNDKSLKRILEKHKQHLDHNIVIDAPVKVVGQTRGIVDLMFSSSVRRHKPNDIENLVVELKAPKIVIGAEEVVQIKKYALAVVRDERFHTVPGIQWHFWVISNSCDDYALGEIEGGPDRKRRLIWRNDNVAVGIKTWAELIEENRGRLQFFREHLEHNADESQVLRDLRERHSEFLAGVIDEDELTDQADDEEEVVAS